MCLFINHTDDGNHKKIKNKMKSRQSQKSNKQKIHWFIIIDFVILTSEHYRTISSKHIPQLPVFTNFKEMLTSSLQNTYIVLFSAKIIPQGRCHCDHHIILFINIIIIIYMFWNTYRYPDSRIIYCLFSYSPLGTHLQRQSAKI